MDNGEVGIEKDHWYRILLGVLTLMIVGLTIGIIVTVNSRENSESNEVVSNYDLPEELDKDNLSVEEQVIRDTTIMAQDPDVDDEKIERYYDDVINEANKRGDYGLSMKIIVQKVLFLVTSEDDCEKAEEYLSNLDTSMYSRDDIAALQSKVYSAIWSCDGIGEEE